MLRGRVMATTQIVRLWMAQKRRGPKAIELYLKKGNYTNLVLNHTCGIVDPVLLQCYTSAINIKRV